MKMHLCKLNEQALSVRLHQFTREDVAKIKSIAGSRWIPTEGWWTVPYTLEVVDRLIGSFSADVIFPDALLEEECYLFHHSVEKVHSVTRKFVQEEDGHIHYRTTQPPCTYVT